MSTLKRYITLVSVLLLSASASLAQDFYLDGNGVTIRCENATLGNTGIINGVEYLAVDNNTLRTERDAGRDMATVCTSQVTELGNLFYDRSDFNDDISSWDTRNITNLFQTFARASSFNRDLSYWDVSNVVTMQSAFGTISSFNSDISGWNVSKVENFHGMFEGNDGFNQDISSWDVSGALNMNYMFNGNDAFNQDISVWDVSKVTTMRQMFQYASAFDQNLSSWCVKSVSVSTNFALGSNLTSQQLPKFGIGCAAPVATLSASATSGRASLDVTFDASGSADPDGDALTYTWDFGDGTTGSGITTEHTYTSPGTYTATLTVSDTRLSSTATEVITVSSPAFYGDLNGTTIRCNDASVGESGIVDGVEYLAVDDTTIRSEFLGGRDMSTVCTSHVSNLNSLFEGRTSFNQDISSWDFSGVTSADRLFWQATAFSQDLSAWNTASLLSAEYMFFQAISFNSDIGGWDVSSLINGNGMLARASSFNQDISGWDVSSAIQLNGMFEGAVSFNQDIGSWDVSNAIDLRSMFYGASQFSQDLSLWCVEKISSTSIDVNFHNGSQLTSDLFPRWGIGCSAPTSVINASATSGPAPLQVTLDATSSVDPDGDALTFVWDLGNGTSATGSDPLAVEYIGVGTYTVSLTVSDSRLSTVSSVDLVVENSPPSVLFAAAPTEGAAPLEVVFNASGSSDPDGDDLSFSWDFGDGSSSSDISPSHTFAVGDYEVMLTVSDGYLESTSGIQISSLNVAPVAVITAADTTGQAPISITFSGSASTDENGDALQFDWEMGDGSTRSGEEVSHFYGAAGDYKVILTVSDGELTSFDSLTVSIASGVGNEELEIPDTYQLRAAYPNPFNPTTTVTYGLPAASEVRITATDLLGRQVATLVTGDMMAAGYHTVQFNADGLASGTYLIRMEAGDFVATQQVVLLK